MVLLDVVLVSVVVSVIVDLFGVLLMVVYCIEFEFRSMLMCWVFVRLVIDVIVMVLVFSVVLVVNVVDMYDLVVYLLLDGLRLYLIWFFCRNS